MKNILFLVIILLVIVSVYILYLKTNEYLIRPRTATPDFELITAYDLNSDIELTLRIAANPKLINHLYCNLLRSTTLFWNNKYGDVVLILDAEDRSENIPHKLNAIGLPFYFRGAYEKEPKKVEKFVGISTKHGVSLGYIRMLYSSFIMDQFTTASVIAWIDSDVVFTMPIVNQSIFSNGKLIVKGANTFDGFNWLPEWDHSTVIALGLPIVADFMSFFPTYVYPSTIKNCRNFIKERLKASTFEDAFIQMSYEKISPVNVILSYAYYYERNQYKWHIDIGTMKLHQYNEWRLPKHPLLITDIQPELHVSVHAGYYKSEIDPLEQAICYTQIHLGMKGVKHCEHFYNQTNMQLFEFQKEPILNHFNTWCKKPNRVKCERMIDERYANFINSQRDGVSLDTTKLELIENSLKENYQTNCSYVNYVPFR